MVAIVGFLVGVWSVIVLALIGGEMAENACKDVSKAPACDLQWVAVLEKKDE